MDDKLELQEAARSISTDRKSTLLRGLSSTDFSEHFVVPLFKNLGYAFEPPIDDVLIAKKRNAFDQDEVHAILVCSLALTMADKSIVESSINRLLAATDQIVRRYKRASVACTIVSSRSINEKAEEAFRCALHLNVTFVGAHDLMHLIDQHAPELWLRENAGVHRYLNNLRRDLLGDTTVRARIPQDLQTPESLSNATTNERYIELTAYRTRITPQKRLGKVALREDLERHEASHLFERHERLIVLSADAGFGKSTVLRRSALLLAEHALTSTPRARIPFLLRAVDLADSRPLLEYVSRRYREMSQGESAETLDPKRIVIFIDALDEIRTSDTRSDILNQILSFNREYPESQVILSARDYASIKDLPGYRELTEFKIQAIGLTEAAKIVKRSQRAKNNCEALVGDTLRRLQEMHGIELNPLLVSVFAATADDQRPDIPANITELFKKFTELMLGRWDEAKGFNQQYQAPLKDFVLCHVAHKMHSAGAKEWPLDEFSDEVSTFLERRGLQADIPQLLDEVLFRSGLMRVSGANVEFRHLLLQEFFAGRAIVDGDAVDRLLPDEWWRNALVFFFGENPGHEPSLRRSLLNFETRSSEELFNCALTLGLALQACYLVELPLRKLVFERVLNALTLGRDWFISGEGDARYPHLSHAAYYFSGREAVALSIASQFLDDVPATSDVGSFWQIITLLETHNYDAALRRLEQFQSQVSELWFALDVAAFIHLELRPGLTDAEQATLNRCRAKTLERTKPNATAILREVQLQLQEFRASKLPRPGR